MTAQSALMRMYNAGTPGTWQWFGNTASNSIYLATVENGRRYVMCFERWGMHGAAPAFRVEQGDRQSVLVRADELVRFEVGNDIIGVQNIDGSVYRKDVRGIAHPDAEIITALHNAAPAIQALYDAVMHIVVCDYFAEKNRDELYCDFCAPQNLCAAAHALDALCASKDSGDGR